VSAARDDLRDRALAALQGLAIGDALGMPTQLMPRAAINERFGAIDGFHGAAPHHPIAAGMPAGSVTDDTEQALLLARALIDGRGSIDPEDFARRLASWEDDMRARGSLDLLGPSTRAAVAAVLAGVSADEAGRAGVTNGAAMRVTPVGIAWPSDDLPALVDAVREASRVSHDTGIAIAGASAVAAAVSAGIDGADLDDAVDIAVEAARQGARLGSWIAGADVAARIEWAVGLGRDAAGDDGLAAFLDLVGTSLQTQESVPAAFGLLARAEGRGWDAALAGAAAGGDTDTIAAMAGAIGGAIGGSSAFPAAAIELVVRVNSLELEPVVDGLLALRERR
jgi:ADP-ribosylglycohydrolase